MKRVYTLYRVSTKKQVNISDNHENDIPMQRGACQDFVKYRKDWEIVKEFEERVFPDLKFQQRIVMPYWICRRQH